MRQVLHIFRKDLRHHWPESVAFLGLVAAFAWNETRAWEHGNEAATGVGGLVTFQFLLGLTVVLVPVAWSFLAARVIQSESLVGDRQFWVTRPYAWKKLLAEKLLFVVVFVNLPLLGMQVFLLAASGFSPAKYVIGLLWMHMLIWLFVLLPVAALAAVTRTIAQILLALFILVLYMMGVGFLSGYIPSSSFSGPMGSVSAGLFILGCVLAILLQYSRRETAKSRIVLGGVAVLLLVIDIATPYQTIVNHEFPRLAPGEIPPLQMSLLPPDEQFSKERFPEQDKNEVQMRMPMRVSGIRQDSLVGVDGVFVDIESADGERWDSGWRSRGGFLFPERSEWQLDFAMKKKKLERFKSAPVRIRLAVAFTVFQNQNSRNFVVPRGNFLLPEVGHCSTDGPYSRMIRCLAPLRRPSFLLMRADMSKNSCPPQEGEPLRSPEEVAWGWVQGDSAPADFGISPIKTVNLDLMSTNFSSRWGAGVCPGTEITFSNPQMIRSNQIEQQFDGVQLAGYSEGVANASGSDVVLPLPYAR